MGLARGATEGAIRVAVQVLARSTRAAMGFCSLPIPAPGCSITLGLAGGPLLTGLVLGRLGRTGPLVWSSPYGANLTLRQFGLVLFLAGAGLQAGSVLGGTLDRSAALTMLLSGATVSLVCTLLTISIGHRVLRIPLGAVVGMLAGVQTQPAVLAYAVEKTARDTPNVGYAAVFPIAMISKISLAQLLLHAVR